MKARAVKKRFVVGVDLGGTKILAAVLDANHRILAREKKSTHPELGPQGVIGRVAECVTETLAAAAIPHSAVVALGVGVPSPVDPRTGLALMAPNLGWKNVPVGKWLQKQLHMPVHVINDVRAGTLAVRHLGAGRRLHDFVCMFIGTGVGGGVVVDGELYQGNNGAAGEIGHMVVVPRDGPKCGCGRRGCLEAVASRGAIVRRVLAAMDKGRKTMVYDLCDGDTSRIRSRILAEAYRNGDKLVRTVIDDACEYLGIAAANVINVFNPQAIILGGGLFGALADKMLPLIRKSTLSHTFASSAQRTPILDSGLGDDAGFLGAALAARAKAKP